jgi:hypothetical protein
LRGQHVASPLGLPLVQRNEHPMSAMTDRALFCAVFSPLCHPIY